MIRSTIVLLSLLVLVSCPLRAGDIEGQLASGTTLGTVGEREADWELEMTESAVNRMLAKLCTLYGQSIDPAKERFREIAVTMSGEYCEIEGVAVNFKLGPKAVKPMRFKVTCELFLGSANQFDLRIRDFDISWADGSGSLGLKIFGSFALRLVALAKRNTKLNGYVELSTSGFSPIPIIGNLPFWKRMVHVKLTPKLIPALGFLDKVQMSRRADRFILRGTVSAAKAKKVGSFFE